MPPTRVALGVLLLAGGGLLLVTARRERGLVPPWVPRLATAILALGISALATTQRGLGWSISSICFSLIAIILIATVLRELTRRK